MKCADDKELTLIQGIIDVFWIEEDGIVVLDYKTDRVKTGKELGGPLCFAVKALRRGAGADLQPRK